MSNEYSVQNSNNIFDIFPKYELSKQSFVPSITKEIKDTLEIADQNSHNKKTLASSVLTTGILGILLVKGLPIQKLSSKISIELQEAGAASTKTTIYYAKKGTDRTLNFLQATSNFTAMKDILFDKLFSLNQLSAKFAQGARNLSKKIVDNALGKQYDDVGKLINDVVSTVQKYNIRGIDKILEKGNPLITIKGETKKLSEWRDILIKNSAELQEAFNDGFSLGARKTRSDNRDELLKGTGEKIYNKLFKDGGWKNFENYKTYITETETKEAREILKNDVAKARKTVTNNIEVIHDNIKNDITELSRSIKPKDNESSKILDNISKNLEKFKACSGANEAEARKEISKKMVADIEKTISEISNNNIYTEAEKKELIAKAQNIKLQIQSSDETSKGILEHIMTVLKGLNSEEAAINGKKIISDSQFKEFEHLSRKISNGLNEAATLESGEYFIKHAEMEVGSAATDVFSILFPVGVGAYAVAKCENKDERISATLKTCIPLVGMFGTFVYGTTKMLSGAKNLIFSTISGFALNKFGAYLDNLYQNYKKSGSVVNVAKVEGKNVWSDLSVGINEQ